MAGDEARPIRRPQEPVRAQALRAVEYGVAAMEPVRRKPEIDDPDPSRAHATPRRGGELALASAGRNGTGGDPVRAV